MSAARWQPTSREALQDLLARAASIETAAAELGICSNTLRRYCHEEAIDLTIARATGGHRLLPLAPEERIARDTEMERVKEERTYYHSLYEEALTQIRSQEDLVAGLAERFVAPRPAPRFTTGKRPAGKKLPQRVAVLLLSDWQLGQLVRMVDTGGMNSFSWDVAERRAARLVAAAVGHIENTLHAYRVDRVIFALLGDIVEGHDVFNGQPWQLEKDAAMQAIDGADLMTSVLTGIMEPFASAGVKFDVYAVPGNHGKPGGRRGGATPATFSFDYLLYEFMRRALSRWPLDHVAVEPAGRLLFEAAGHICLMTHGNEVRGWGGFPYYGLDKAHARLTLELDTLFTYWLLGHWHADATLPAGRGKRIVNGNAVGANQLTTAALLGAAAPLQVLAYFSRDHGLAETAYLYLAQEERTAAIVHGRS